MSVFTTIPKQPLNWQANPNSNVSTPVVFTKVSKPSYSSNAPQVVQTENYYLLVDDTYFLGIGDGYSLIVQDNGAREKTMWGAITKS